MKGEEPIDILKDTAEFYARKGKLEELEKPVLKHFYACAQYWCREAWKQGATKRIAERSTKTMIEIKITGTTPLEALASVTAFGMHCMKNQDVHAAATRVLETEEGKVSKSDTALTAPMAPAAPAVSAPVNPTPAPVALVNPAPAPWLLFR